ncbi:MAG: hypothetical protein AAF420_06855 [Pseudomonadota bacterium]
MKSLKKKIGKVFLVFDNSSIRQRLMVSAAVLVTIHAAWDFVFYQPQTQEQENYTASIFGNQESLTQLNGELQALISAGGKDDREVQLLEEQISQLDIQIDLASSELIRPEQMPDVLQKLLAKNQRLTVTGLKTVPAITVNQPTTESMTETEISGADGERNNDQNSDSQLPPSDPSFIPIYKHLVELEFEGDYLSALQYIQSIEHLGWRIFWDSVRIDSTEYPQSRVTVSVYTLSLDEGWIGV